MNKQDIRSDIENRIAQGEGKSSVFQALKGQGVSDRTLANLIASHADPKLIARHAGLIKGMVVISWVQLVLGVLAGLNVAFAVNIVAGLLVMVLIGAFSYLFIWGFRNSRAWAYNASILLSIISLPRALSDMATEPGSSLFALVLGGGVDCLHLVRAQQTVPGFRQHGAAQGGRRLSVQQLTRVSHHEPRNPAVPSLVR